MPYGPAPGDITHGREIQNVEDEQSQQAGTTEGAGQRQADDRVPFIPYLFKEMNVIDDENIRRANEGLGHPH